MSKLDYDNLEQAEGNDLIDEQNRLFGLITAQLDDSQLLNDFESVVRQLTINEEC